MSGAKPPTAHLRLNTMLRGDILPLPLRYLRPVFNILKPNDIYIYICRTAALTSRRYILNINSTNIHNEYFKHAA